MTFPQRLERIAGLIEQRLEEIICQKVELEPADAGTSARLVAAIRHGALGGGKRFRPFLVAESAALFGVPLEASLDAGAAIECVHCYSLVHDDLPAMDNDETRRGQPTVWKAFDEWTAILAGDALLTLAFEILAGAVVHKDAGVRLQLIASLAQAGGALGMVGGQAFDLEADKLGIPAAPSAAHVRRLQSMKTGALIEVSCESGAILGQASAEERAALRRYGAALGRAFQIADDLLDYEGDAATVGKAVAKDAAAGKATFLSLVGIDAARAELAKAEANAVAALEPFGGRAAVLREAAEFVSRRTK
jgi:farnesyl diphosphate synthase